jgi:DNA-binding PadR family transcriptional regulator
MGIQHAVLGLLAERPSYGYELKTTFEAAIGPQWGDLNIGHLYQVLDRLVRDRLVTRKVHPQADRPDRVVYRLTKLGKDALEEWLAHPPARHSGYRDEFSLKLFVASKLGPDRLRTVISLQRERCLADLAALGTLRRNHREDSLVSILIEAAVLHTRADLRVAESAEHAADRIADQARARARGS